MKKIFQPSAEELEAKMDVVHTALAAACETSHGRYKAEDLIQQVKDRSVQLWFGYDGDDFDIIALTTIIAYPQARTLSFFCLTGVRIQGWQQFLLHVNEWLPLIKGIEDWGITVGCTLFQIECPAPWERFLKEYGYAGTHVTLYKEAV